jgi:hypothetical protein
VRIKNGNGVEEFIFHAVSDRMPEAVIAAIDAAIAHRAGNAGYL